MRDRFQNSEMDTAHAFSSISPLSSYREIWNHVVLASTSFNTRFLINPFSPVIELCSFKNFVPFRICDVVITVSHLMDAGINECTNQMNAQKCLLTHSFRQSSSKPSTRESVHRVIAAHLAATRTSKCIAHLLLCPFSSDQWGKSTGKNGYFQPPNGRTRSFS